MQSVNQHRGPGAQRGARGTKAKLKDASEKEKRRNHRRMVKISSKKRAAGQRDRSDSDAEDGGGSTAGEASDETTGLSRSASKESVGPHQSSPGRGERTDTARQRLQNQEVALPFLPQRRRNSSSLSSRERSASVPGSANIATPEPSPENKIPHGGGLAAGPLFSTGGSCSSKFSFARSCARSPVAAPVGWSGSGAGEIGDHHVDRPELQQKQNHRQQLPATATGRAGSTSSTGVPRGGSVLQAFMTSAASGRGGIGGSTTTTGGGATTLFGHGATTSTPPCTPCPSTSLFWSPGRDSIFNLPGVVGHSTFVKALGTRTSGRCAGVAVPTSGGASWTSKQTSKEKQVKVKEYGAAASATSATSETTAADDLNAPAPSSCSSSGSGDSAEPSPAEVALQCPLPRDPLVLEVAQVGQGQQGDRDQNHDHRPRPTRKLPLGPRPSLLCEDEELSAPLVPAPASAALMKLPPAACPSPPTTAVVPPKNTAQDVGSEFIISDTSSPPVAVPVVPQPSPVLDAVSAGGRGGCTARLGFLGSGASEEEQRPLQAMAAESRRFGRNSPAIANSISSPKKIKRKDADAAEWDYDSEYEAQFSPDERERRRRFPFLRKHDSREPIILPELTGLVPGGTDVKELDRRMEAILAEDERQRRLAEDQDEKQPLDDEDADEDNCSVAENTPLNSPERRPAASVTTSRAISGGNHHQQQLQESSSAGAEETISALLLLDGSSTHQQSVAAAGAAPPPSQSARRRRALSNYGTGSACMNMTRERSLMSMFSGKYQDTPLANAMRQALRLKIQQQQNARRRGFGLREPAARSGAGGAEGEAVEFAAGGPGTTASRDGAASSTSRAGSPPVFNRAYAKQVRRHADTIAWLKERQERRRIERGQSRPDQIVEEASGMSSSGVSSGDEAGVSSKVVPAPAGGRKKFSYTYTSRQGLLTSTEGVEAFVPQLNRVVDVEVGSTSESDFEHATLKKAEAARARAVSSSLSLSTPRGGHMTPITEEPAPAVGVAPTMFGARNGSSSASSTTTASATPIPAPSPPATTCVTDTDGRTAATATPRTLSNESQIDRTASSCSSSAGGAALAPPPSRALTHLQLASSHTLVSGPRIAPSAAAGRATTTSTTGAASPRHPPVHEHATLDVDVEPASHDPQRRGRRDRDRRILVPELPQAAIPLPDANREVMAAHCTHQASLLSDEVDEDEVPPHYVYNYDNTTQKMSMRPLSNYTEHIRNFRKPSFLRSVIPDFECSGQGISGSGESENSRGGGGGGGGRSQEMSLPSTTTTGNDVHIITDASASSNLLAQFMNQGASSSEEEQGVDLPDAGEDDEEKLRMTDKELAALHAREEEELIMRLKEIPADSSNSEPGSGNEGHDHNDAAELSTARPSLPRSSSSTSTSVPQFSQSLGRAQYPYPRSSSAAKDKEDTTGTGEPREPGTTSTAMGKKKTTRRTKKKPQQTAQQRDSLRANLAEKQCEGLLLKIRRQTELGERVDAFQVIDKVRRICESAQLKSETEKKLMKRILPMVETVVAPSPAETGLLVGRNPTSGWNQYLLGEQGASSRGSASRHTSFHQQEHVGGYHDHDGGNNMRMRIGSSSPLGGNCSRSQRHESGDLSSEQQVGTSTSRSSFFGASTAESRSSGGDFRGGAGAKPSVVNEAARTRTTSQQQQSALPHHFAGGNCGLVLDPDALTQALGQLMEKPASNWRMWGCDLDAQFDARTEIEDTEVQSADRPRREDRKRSADIECQMLEYTTSQERAKHQVDEVDDDAAATLTRASSFRAEDVPRAGQDDDDAEFSAAPSRSSRGKARREAAGKRMAQERGNSRSRRGSLRDELLDAKQSDRDHKGPQHDRRDHDHATATSSSSRNKPARTQATRQHFMPEELDLGSERPGKMHMQCLSKKALKKEEQKKLARKAQREKRLEKATSPARTTTSGRAAPGSSPPTKPKAKGRSSEPTVAVASSSSANDDANAAQAAPKPTVMETREQLAPAVADAGDEPQTPEHKDGASMSSTDTTVGPSTARYDDPTKQKPEDDGFYPPMSPLASASEAPSSMGSMCSFVATSGTTTAASKTSTTCVVDQHQDISKVTDKAVISGLLAERLRRSISERRPSVSSDTSTSGSGICGSGTSHSSARSTGYTGRFSALYNNQNNQDPPSCIMSNGSTSRSRAAGQQETENITLYFDSSSGSDTGEGDHVGVSSSEHEHDYQPVGKGGRHTPRQTTASQKYQGQLEESSRASSLQASPQRRPAGSAQLFSGPSHLGTNANGAPARKGSGSSTTGTVSPAGTATPSAAGSTSASLLSSPSLMFQQQLHFPPLSGAFSARNAPHGLQHASVAGAPSPCFTPSHQHQQRMTSPASPPSAMLRNKLQSCTSNSWTSSTETSRSGSSSFDVEHYRYEYDATHQKMQMVPGPPRGPSAGARDMEPRHDLHHRNGHYEDEFEDLVLETEDYSSESEDDEAEADRINAFPDWMARAAQTLGIQPAITMPPLGLGAPAPGYYHHQMTQSQGQLQQHSTNGAPSTWGLQANLFEELNFSPPSKPSTAEKASDDAADTAVASNAPNFAEHDFPTLGSAVFANKKAAPSITPGTPGSGAPPPLPSPTPAIVPNGKPSASRKSTASTIQIGSGVTGAAPALVAPAGGAGGGGGAISRSTTSSSVAKGAGGRVATAKTGVVPGGPRGTPAIKGGASSNGNFGKMNAGSASATPSSAAGGREVVMNMGLGLGEVQRGILKTSIRSRASARGATGSTGGAASRKESIEQPGEQAPAPAVSTGAPSGGETSCSAPDIHGHAKLNQSGTENSSGSGPGRLLNWKQITMGGSTPSSLLTGNSASSSSSAAVALPPPPVAAATSSAVAASPSASATPPPPPREERLLKRHPTSSTTISTSEDRSSSPSTNESNSLSNSACASPSATRHSSRASSVDSADGGGGNSGTARTRKFLPWGRMHLRKERTQSDCSTAETDAESNASGGGGGGNGEDRADTTTTSSSSSSSSSNHNLLLSPDPQSRPLLSSGKNASNISNPPGSGGSSPGGGGVKRPASESRELEEEEGPPLTWAQRIARRSSVLGGTGPSSTGITCTSGVAAGAGAGAASHAASSASATGGLWQTSSSASAAPCPSPSSAGSSSAPPGHIHPGASLVTPPAIVRPAHTSGLQVQPGPAQHSPMQAVSTKTTFACSPRVVPASSHHLQPQSQPGAITSTCEHGDGGAGAAHQQLPLHHPVASPLIAAASTSSASAERRSGVAATQQVGGAGGTAQAHASVGTSISSNPTLSVVRKGGPPASKRVPSIKKKLCMRLPTIPTNTELDTVLWKALENARLNSLKTMATSDHQGPAPAAGAARSKKASRLSFAKKTEIRFHDDDWPPDKFVLQTGIGSKEFDGQSQHRALHSSEPKRVLDQRALFQLAISMSVQRFSAAPS